MRIAVRGFGGTTPGVAPHLLAETDAQLCINALRENGNLVAMKTPLQTAVLTTIGATIKTLFRHGTSYLTWPGLVDVVRAPIANDTLGRIIFTGDGAPKFTDATLALSAPPYPTTAMNLALPSPLVNISESGHVEVVRKASGTLWSDSTIFSEGDMVYPGNDRAYQAGADGQSGTESPDWSTVTDLGDTITDNTITWTCIMIVSTGARKWFAATDVQPGALVEVGDYLLRALPATSGTTGSVEPDWAAAATLGATIDDGTITWTNAGALASGTAWAATTTKTFGDFVYENGTKFVASAIAGLKAGTTDLFAPANDSSPSSWNERTSGTVEPTWPTGLGATVTDAGITWTNAGVFASGSAWAASHLYTMGGFIREGGYKFTAAATTPTSQGLWLGNTITDGTVRWTVERVVSSGARYLNTFRSEYVKTGGIYEVLNNEIGSLHNYLIVYTATKSGVTGVSFNADTSINHDDHGGEHFHVGNRNDGGTGFAPDAFGYGYWYPNTFARHTAVSKTYAALTAFVRGDCLIVDGFVYGCTTQGTTAASRGPWPQTVGQTITDGTAKFTCRGPARFDTNVGREASTIYAVGAIQTMNGFNYIVRTAGRTGTETPTWTTKVGETVPDGDVLWECMVFSGLSDQEDVSYVETFVRKYQGVEDESLPSPAVPLRIYTINFSAGESLLLTGLNVPTGSNHGVTHRRLYRLAAGGGSAEYLFLDELPIDDTDYADTKPTDQLGEPLIAAEFDPPPDALAGLTIMPGGILAGFVGKVVYFCEPYQFHAWPVRYQILVEDAIVALGVFGNSLLVSTTGTPYVITGSRPGYMSVDRIEINEACLSKPGMVDLGSAIAYPSPNGLIVIGRGINKNVTEGTHRLQDWQALHPETFIGFNHRGRYFAFFDVGFEQQLLSIDLNGQVGFYQVSADCAWSDAQSGETYLVQGQNVLKFNAGSALSMVWKSKPFYRTTPQGFGVGQVRSKTYPLWLALNAEGTTIHTQTVTGPKPFRLPSHRAISEEFVVTGTSEVELVILADSMYELTEG